MLRNVANALECPPSASNVCETHETKIRLLTGYAGGADSLAVEEGDALGDHFLHVVFPYLSSDGKSAFTDREANVGDKPAPAIPEDATITVLDGAAAEARQPYRDGHMEQCRWIVKWADVLVVVWNGGNAAGVGGTADAVELAVRRRLPIVWIDPGEPKCIRLIDGNTLWENMALREIANAISTGHVADVSDPVDQAALTRIISSRIRPAWLFDEQYGDSHATRPSLLMRPLRWIGLLPPEVRDHPEHSALSEREALEAYVQRFSDERETMGGWISWLYRFETRRWSRPFQLLGWLWIPYLTSREKKAAKRDEVSAGSVVPDLLKRELDKSDAFANGVSRQHRSEQILLLVLATIAVLIGVLPSLVTESVYYWYVKLACVIVEAVLLFIMYIVWIQARRMRRHRIWSDSRRYAERLRVLQSTWPFGFDVNDHHVSAPGTWTEWRAQELIRSIGPPSGVMNTERLKQVSVNGWNSIIRSQAVYHRRNAGMMHAIHQRFDATESLLFFILLFCLLSFVVVGWAEGTFVPAFDSGHKGHGDHHGLPHWTANALLVMSAVFPAMGACCIALAAQLDIVSSGNKSSRLLARFNELDLQMQDALRAFESPEEKGSLLRARELVRDAARLALSDADAWQIELDRRRIIRGP